ncbi:MAG: GNAT family N-acetyltransferase [Caldilineaceae bacterium]
MLKRQGEIVQYWATKLEIPANLLQASGIHIVRKSNVISPDRVVAYRTEKTTIVLLPKQMDEQIEGELATVLSSTVAGSELPKTLPLRQRWRDFIYYRGTPIDRVGQSAQIRLLTHLDEEQLTHLQSACAEQEIQAAQISIVDPLIVGYFVAEQLVGAASLLYEGSAIADVGILVHPAYRRKGMAVALVQCVANLGMAQGKVIQYMAEERNHGSVHTAGRSGFELFLFEDGFEVL